MLYGGHEQYENERGKSSVCELRRARVLPCDFFPGDVSVLEVTQHVHLTENAVLVEQQVVVVVVAAMLLLLFVVVVFVITGVSQLTPTRRQQTLRLTTTRTAKNYYLSTCK